MHESAGGQPKAFFQKGLFRVTNAVHDGSRKPRVEINAGDALFVALRLAREGWCGGDPEKVLATRVDLVVAMMQYEIYKTEYERAWIELNREKE